MEFFDDALFHLVGGLVGEGDGEDMTGGVAELRGGAEAPGAVGATDAYEEADISLGESESLAGAC